VLVSDKRTDPSEILGKSRLRSVDCLRRTGRKSRVPGEQVAENVRAVRGAKEEEGLTTEPAVLEKEKEAKKKKEHKMPRPTKERTFQGVARTF